MIILKVNELENVSFSDMQNFVDILTADNKYSLLNKDNLTQPIQMQFSRKEKAFFSIFLWIFDIYIKF